MSGLSEVGLSTWALPAFALTIVYVYYAKDGAIDRARPRKWMNAPLVRIVTPVEKFSLEPYGLERVRGSLDLDLRPPQGSGREVRWSVRNFVEIP